MHPRSLLLLLFSILIAATLVFSAPIKSAENVEDSSQFDDGDVDYVDEAYPLYGEKHHWTWYYQDLLHRTTTTTTEDPNMNYVNWTPWNAEKRKEELAKRRREKELLERMKQMEKEQMAKLLNRRQLKGF